MLPEEINVEKKKYVPISAHSIHLAMSFEEHFT
jgi:hypothetical protein